uniref:Uncharacterized protein n=1 Tax=Lepeophtheirus salmonis TaxID=72036 RepID=A0A0K2VGF3_LEPSM
MMMRVLHVYATFRVIQCAMEEVKDCKNHKHERCYEETCSLQVMTRRTTCSIARKKFEMHPFGLTYWRNGEARPCPVGDIERHNPTLNESSFIHHLHSSKACSKECD